MSVIPGLAGLVLAGGKSSRFGTDKAVQKLGGKTLLERSVDVLRPICATIYVNAKEDSEPASLASNLGLLVIDETDQKTDEWRGVLAGIEFGLALLSSSARVATIPCDTPLVTTDVYRRLAREPTGAYAVTPSGPQALCAIWPTAARDKLRHRLDSGDYPPVRRFLDEIGAKAVPFDDEAIFANINTPADLQALRDR